METLAEPSSETVDPITGAPLGAELSVPRVPGKYERLCWERHQKDLALAARPGGHPKGFTFDPESGDRVVLFIERYCRHHKGEWAGRPLLLEDWQKDILRIVFGWKRADRTRRFRTAYIEVPRKQGKTEKAAGVGLYLLVADDEPGAEVYSTATKKDQAKLVWSFAGAMVARSPALRKFVQVFKTGITCERTASKFEPLSAESKTLDGLNAHGHISDEMHAHADRHVYDVVATSMGARRQPLNWIITTAGLYDPESIGWQMHERAQHVLDGVIEDDSFFAFIASADAEDDWTDPATWAKANPNLGVSVKLDYLRDECEKAKTTPSYLNTFLRYHLDRWTQSREVWIPVERWNACTRVVDEAALTQRTCCAGLDLSTTLDITALVLAFPRDDIAPDAMDLVFRFWCPEETILKRSSEDRVPYDAWARDGWIIPTPGNVVDYSFVVAALDEFAKQYQIAEAGYDPWNATKTALELQDKGLTMVEVRQGFQSLTEPSKEFEKLATSGKLGHATPKGVHPVMRWMVANAAVKRDPADNIKPDKSSAIGRIDGVPASIVALSRAMLHRDDVSVYETRGVIAG